MKPWPTADAPKGALHDADDAYEPRRPPDIQNRAWSLARACPQFSTGGHHGVGPDLSPIDKAPTAKHEIVVGCENGEVWRVTWSRGEAPVTENFCLAARLGRPVRALAYRKDYSGEVSARIFAGGDDGSIVAWQEKKNPGAAADENTTGPSGQQELPFTTLWATSEAAAVTSISLCSYRPGDPRAPPVLVVATFRHGRAVMFDDRAGPLQPGSSPDTNPHPQRFQFPGNRHSRLVLGDSALAGWLLPKACLPLTPWLADERFIGVLVTATDRGTIRVFAVDHPRYSPERSQRLYKLFRRWWSVALNHRGGDVQYHLADALSRAAPNLPLILVRWLIDANLDPDLTADSVRVPPWAPFVYWRSRTRATTLSPFWLVTAVATASRRGSALRILAIVLT